MRKRLGEFFFVAAGEPVTPRLKKLLHPRVALKEQRRMMAAAKCRGFAGVQRFELLPAFISTEKIARLCSFGFLYLRKIKVRRTPRRAAATADKAALCIDIASYKPVSVI